MGLYDSIYFEDLAMLNLKEGENQEFQTEDFDCTLSIYHVGASGNMNVRHRSFPKGFSDPEPLTITQGINFYTHSKDGVWIEFFAKIKEGTMMEIRRLHGEIYSESNQ